MMMVSLGHILFLPEASGPCGFHPPLGCVYVAKGLTPLEALQVATLNPAKSLAGH